MSKMELPDANEVAEKLCIKAESLGLCHPTETMIAECLHDFEWNALMYPEEGWVHHGGKPDIRKQPTEAFECPYGAVSQENCTPMRGANECAHHTKCYFPTEGN